MNQKCLLTDILSTLKGVSDLYLHGTIESATPEIRETFKQALNETLDMQNQTYKLMEQLSYYQTTNVDMNKINQLKDKMSDCCCHC